jgi:hypothetical protein
MKGLDIFLVALESFNSNWILLVVDVVLEVSDRDSSTFGIRDSLFIAGLPGPSQAQNCRILFIFLGLCPALFEGVVVVDVVVNLL